MAHGLDRWRFEAACDPEVLRPALERGLEGTSAGKVHLVDLQVPRAFPRPQGGITLQLCARVHRDGAAEPQPLVLGGHLLSSSEAWPSYVETHARKVLRFAELRLVVPLFPYDPGLRLLPQLLRDDLALLLLRHVGVTGLDGTVALESRVLGYRLERRCVVHYRQVAGSRCREPVALVAKTFRPGRLTGVGSAIRTLAKAEATSLAPTTRLLDNGRGLHVMEEVSGRSLHELVATEDFASGCAAAGAALARLHHLPKESFRWQCVEGALRPLDGLVDLACQLFPPWSEQLGAVHDAVRATRPAELESREEAVVHGDFYDKQVLISRRGAVILDWDGLVCGDPARDVGNFTAHVALRALQTPERAEPIEAGVASFAAGYGAGADEFAARARWWEATTLLRLAVLYGLRLRWQHLVPSLLGRATRSLDSLAKVAVLALLTLTGTPPRVQAQAPEYMQIEPRVGQALEISGSSSAAGLFVASDVEVLPQPRPPQLRGALQEVDAAKGILVVHGVRVQLGENTSMDVAASGGSALANLRPGQRVEVSCAVDEQGNWSVHRLQTEAVKASDKIKGTITRAAVDGAPPDTLEISGLRILLTSTTDVNVPQEQEFRRERYLFPDLARRDRRRATLSLARDRARFLGEYRGHVRSRSDFDLSRRFDSDASEGLSELRLGVAGYWSESVWSFAQVRVRGRATSVDPEALPHRRLEAQLSQFYLLLRTRGAHRAALQIGRQDFDEPREWIFDEYLDAARFVFYGSGSLVFEAACIRPFHPLDRAIATWTDGFAMARWYFEPQSHLAAWVLARSDRDAARNRQPLWIGARYLGQLPGTLRPWLDLAWMGGEDKHRTLRAWGIDAGCTWLGVALPGVPSFTAGYAVGSGDASTADGVDGNFRQTGYEDNWSRFGGVVSQKIYGALLDPELSNLEIATLGLGVRPLPDASIELLWHRYRQQAAQDKLQGSNLIDPPARPNGASRDLGWTVEVVAAAPSLWGRLRATWTCAFFRPGAGFNPRREDALWNRLDLTAWF